MLEVQPKHINELRGEKLVSVKKWERPLTSEEKSKRELWHKVSGELEKGKVPFEQNTSPQKIVAHIVNTGKSLIYIKSIRFQPIKLSEAALLASTKRDGAIDIPFSESDANLMEGQSIPVELKLRQKWLRSDIEKIRGEMGFLLFDVIYDGKLVEGVIIPI